MDTKPNEKKSKTNKEGTGNNGNILIVLPNHIGDAIFALPAINSIKERFSKSRIDILINKNVVGILKDESNIDKIISINPWWEEFWYRHKFFRHQKSFFLKRVVLYLIPFFILPFDKTIKKIRRERYSMAIHFNDDLFRHFLTFLSDAEKRVGFAKNFGKLFLTDIVPYEPGIKHQVERCLDVARFLGGKNKKIKIHLSRENEVFAERIIDQFGKNRKVIGIHPGASKIAPFKKIKIEKWVALINKLIKKYLIIILGGPDEKDLVDKILDLIENRDKVTNLVGRTTLKEMAAILKKCNLLIGLDSAAAHIAAGVGTPVVVLWGSYNEPQIWRPYLKKEIILRKEQINDISLNEILESVEKLL